MYFFKGSQNGFKVLHLTDIHYDGAYTLGTLVDCPYPTCCGVDSGTPSESQKGAGMWGDYDDCDVPMHLLVAGLEWIKVNHVINVQFQ